MAIILNSNKEMLYSIANRFRMLTEKTCLSVEKKHKYNDFRGRDDCETGGYDRISDSMG